MRALLLVSAAVLAVASTTHAQDATVPVTFTAEQAARGQLTFTRRCSDCHGSALDNGENGGAPLKGEYFRNHWGNGSVATLVAYTKARMPPDRPGGLSDQSYVELIAFLLQSNGYAASATELPVDPQKQAPMTLKRRP